MPDIELKSKVTWYKFTTRLMCVQIRLHFEHMPRTHVICSCDEFKWTYQKHVYNTLMCLLDVGLYKLTGLNRQLWNTRVVKLSEKWQGKMVKGVNIIHDLFRVFPLLLYRYESSTRASNNTNQYFSSLFLLLTNKGHRVFGLPITKHRKHSLCVIYKHESTTTNSLSHLKQMKMHGL